MKISARYLLNPVFLSSLTILLFNDFVLKQQYHNEITGKLSDFSGIIVFTMFINSLFLYRKKIVIYFCSSILFILWKSDLSQPFIEFWNNFFPNFILCRTIDYSDIFCLFILIPVYKYEPSQLKLRLKKELLVYPLATFTLLTIFATSKHTPCVAYSNQTIEVREIIKVKTSRTAFLNQLTKDGISYKRDSIIILSKDTFDLFILKDIVLKSGKLKSAIIGLHDKRNKTEIWIQELELTETKIGLTGYDEYEEWMKKYQVESKDYFRKFGD